jgi:hypothetical protein
LHDRSVTEIIRVLNEPLIRKVFWDQATLGSLLPGDQIEGDHLTVRWEMLLEGEGGHPRPASNLDDVARLHHGH